MTAHRDRGVSSIAATVTPAGGKNAGPTPAPNDCHDSTAPTRYVSATQANSPAADRQPTRLPGRRLPRDLPEATGFQDTFVRLSTTFLLLREFYKPIGRPA